MIFFIATMQTVIGAIPAWLTWAWPSVHALPFVAVVALAGTGSHYCLSKAISLARCDCGDADGLPAAAAFGASARLLALRGPGWMVAGGRRADPCRQLDQHLQGQPPVTSAEQHRQHRIGLLLAAGAALCWSTSGLFVRGISADLMTMLFWRGLFSSSAVFALFFYMERGRSLGILRALGWPALGVALLSAMSMIAGISALRFTTVADAMVIYATVPFVTAALAYVVIGERPSRSTLIEQCGGAVRRGRDAVGRQDGRQPAGPVLRRADDAGHGGLQHHHAQVPQRADAAGNGSVGLGSVVCMFLVCRPVVGQPARFPALRRTLASCRTLRGWRSTLSRPSAFPRRNRRFSPRSKCRSRRCGVRVPRRDAVVQTLVGGGIVLAALLMHILSGSAAGRRRWRCRPRRARHLAEEDLLLLVGHRLLVGRAHGAIDLGEAGRALMASNQRFRCGNSLRSWL